MVAMPFSLPYIIGGNIMMHRYQAAAAVLGMAFVTLAAGAVQAQEMKVALGGGGWTGARVPQGQQCRLFGGNGGTPPLRVSGIPAGADDLVVAFDDLDYAPLSSGGGHGTIGFAHKGGASATLRAVPGMTASLPAGARVVAAAKSWGEYASPGYLPPCSGGRGHRYQATVKAMKGGSEVARATIVIGTY